MITLYWAPKTRAVRMFWALEEVGQPYELAFIDFRAKDREDPAAFKAASPLGKLPAIVDGDVRMADSAAIALYLADRYAPGDLAPRIDDPARGEFLFWLFYTPSAMEPAMTEKFVDLPANPAAYPWGSFDRMMSALETRLAEREWVAADRFTMADFMISGTLSFMETMKVLAPSPVLRFYMQRCLERPAAVRGREKEEAATAALNA
ncbi:glutathione S-transferase family protein [Pararhizobium mangrovi]|uniref:Glutathione S-transferase n=1 Tax=Pararhizobium mangrovi TaxID=2590452 RepID=A0A506U6N0_9HYPH|nr:glutathione S-transferase [Pararhizobium mangrovi]TPW28724.1 glutathione S-transferase [Pararhizobium mangrovi]